jgi:hypothetical protein
MTIPPPDVAEVYGTTRFVGFHRWPDADAATQGRRGYLADVHRHTFVASASLAVDHDDRAVEFHDITEELDTWVTLQPHDTEAGGVELGAQSCEMVAAQVAAHLDGCWRGQVRSVEVSEDSEHGAVLRWA